MPSADFSLEPLQEEDIPRCVSIYFAAFQNPHSLGCWPRSQTTRNWWEDSIEDELDDEGANWFKVVHKFTEQVVGFCKWIAPKPGVLPDTKLPEWPADGDKALCDETFGAWASKKVELMGRRGHWYLEIIATDPAYQGQGAGSLMMQWGTRKADQDGVECYLEASPDAVAVYEKYGFKEGGRVDTYIDNERVKETWYRNLFMIRQPRSSQES